MKRALKWTGFTLGALLLVVLAATAWVVNTQSGTRSIARIAVDALGGKLALGEIEGTIAGPLTVTDLRYNDPEAGIDARLQRIHIDIELSDIFRALVHVHELQASGIDVALSEPTKPPEKSPKPFRLKPPIDIEIDSLALDSARIRRDQTPLVELTRAAFSGHWTSRDLAVKQLDVHSPQGEVEFVGSVRQRGFYTGGGHGRFRWKVGERSYAGTLETRTENVDAKLTLQLSAPIDLQLQAQVTQKKTWPWRFTLEAPRFDPREALLPQSSFTSLAASLSGHGSMDEGAISGKLVLNEEQLMIEPLRFTRNGDDVAIDTVLRISHRNSGSIHIGGDVHLGSEPVTAKVAATWNDIVVPAAWVGQELFTHGRLDLQGSAEQYAAQGALALGAQDRVADIALDLQGTPQRVELKQFDISQEAGRMQARGRIDLQPQLAWDVSATAKDFDPGAFAAAWRGKLGFELASQGRMLEQGPKAKLQLTQLRGELRGRPLSGNADVSLAPPLIASGTALLKSGNSELQFRGRNGDRLDANVSLNVASLNDWVPDSGGELHAAFVVRGKWPDLSIEGNARGRDLHAAGVRMESFNAQANVADPRNPEGSIRLDLAKLTAAGFQFETVRAEAKGAPKSHHLALRVSGEPLALDLDLQGAQTDEGWAGSLQNLVINVKDAARLALREPANITLSKGTLGKGTAELSQACLVDGRIELCAAGALQPDGAIRASYSLANLPLALGNALATAELPIKLEGTLQGHGEIRRTPQGELFGDVSIESESGSIFRQLAAVPGDQTQEPPQKLLGYRGFKVAATLSGPDARATLDTQLEPNATLHGEANVHDLGRAETPIAGRLRGQIPDLAPLAVFAPQLANVHGRIDADIALAGTVQTPELSGLISGADLAADIPAVGLKLKKGQLQVRPAPSGDITVDGAIVSGDGRLQFSGKADRSGRVDMHVGGDRVLAADIPGARVIVTPNLNLVRTADRVTLNGDVTIPEATINLQKLPRGGAHAQAASSDVIVVDAQTREAEAAEQAPVFAEITVNIGKKVDLTGFGLQANVEGALQVRESPGQPTLGSGEVRVAGKYKAYGQDLTIQRGQLLYAWTPLDNPNLNIEATRAVEAVTAGLRIRGNAKNPELTVYSDPPMSQANALSYLVAGKPLDQIGAGDSDADAMQTAARSLGVAGGGLLAKSLGKRLGVDELSVKDDEMIGGAALTVGQYLSPRLYLSYGVGLFEPGDVITLRYKLSDELALQTQRGPEDTRAGIEYRIEK